MTTLEYDADRAGLSIPAQAFHTLAYMILFLVTFSSLSGHGLGVGLRALQIAVARARLPDYAASIAIANLGVA